MRARICLTILLLAFARIASAAELPVAEPSWEARQSALCTAAIGRAEQHWGVPHNLLLTMGKVESGRPIGKGGLQPWPWTIDADGQGYFFESKAAAIAWAEQASGRGVRLMDVGCMQVNLQMHPDAFASLDVAFDPASNADYAAHFLRRLRDGNEGNWFIATGFYHSQTPVLAAAYRADVADVAAGRAPTAGAMVPLYLRAMQKGAVLLSFSGGHVGVINTRRQPAARPRRYSACQIAAALGDYLRARPEGCARHLG
jgi:hypothetical protein